MPVTLAEICAALPTLSKEEVDQVMLRCRALVHYSRQDEATPIEASAHNWLIKGIKNCLRRRGHPYKLPDAVIQQQKPYLKFVAAADTVGPWLLTLIPEMNRTERLLLSDLAADCLARRIASYMPVSLGTLLQQYATVPEALEDTFPTYIENKWFPLVIRRKR